MPRINPRRTGYNVVDSDTIRLSTKIPGFSNRNVRLAGVDGPEPNERGAKETKAMLNRLLQGKPITVETVGVSYGRPVAIVRSGGRNVNKALKRFISQRGY